MAHSLSPRRPARAVTKFSRVAVAIGGGSIALIAVAGLLLPRLWAGWGHNSDNEPQHAQQLILPEVITRDLPVQFTRTASAPIVQDVPPKSEPHLIQAPDTSQDKSLLDMMKPFPTTAPPNKAPEKPVGEGATAARRTPPKGPGEETLPIPVPPKKRWDLLASPDQGTATAAMGEMPEALAERTLEARAGGSRSAPGKEQTAQDDPAKKLIQPARWAIPANPLRTIYRSQTLAGQLLQAINSDIPGQVKIQLTVPVLDKFGYDTVILPKDTLIIAAQEGRAIYGTSRLGLRLEQLELPSGEVIELRATVGDEWGSSGVKGKVNNHLGKVVVATGLSALLNIGVRTAVGTPSAGQFFQNPAQEAAQDIGQAVQRDATSIIDRELRIPPTITIKAGTFVTISLQENMSFSRPPLLVR